MKHHRKQRQPRVAKAVKPAKPKTRELRTMLKGIVSALPAYRINAMAQAMQWYDAAQPYVLYKLKGKIDVKLAKALDIAAKCRNQGIGTTSEGEKETSFKMALTYYEKFYAILRPPTVNSFYETYEKRKVKLDSKHERIQDRFENILDLLTKACKPTAHDGQSLILVAGEIDTARKNDAMLRQLIYSKEKLQELKRDVRVRGLLPVILEEIPNFATSAGLENHEGKFMLNPAKKMQAYEVLMKNFVEFCQTPEAPKRLVKIVGPNGHQLADPKAPRAPRVPRAPGTGRALKIDGLYAEGSSRAVLYQTMLDGAWRTKKELTKACGSGVGFNLKVLQMKGLRSKLYQIETDGDKVRLVKSAN
jgi:hypothetical protein